VRTAGLNDPSLDAEDNVMAEQSIRVLIAVHGYEPEGWASETGRVVSRWGEPIVRVLGVLDVPCPPLTSPAPFARRLYSAARAAASHDAEQRTEGAVATLAATLPRGTAIVRVPLVPGPLGCTIAEHANDWGPDVVVVGAPGPGFRSRLWPGPVPQQVLQRIQCAILVTAPAPVAPARRLVVVPRIATMGRRA
jgi:nucleotide-binding universal stress UspA family protein